MVILQGGKAEETRPMARSAGLDVEFEAGRKNDFWGGEMCWPQGEGLCELVLGGTVTTSGFRRETLERFGRGGPKVPATATDPCTVLGP